MSEVLPRITGTEMEWAYMVPRYDTPPDEPARYRQIVGKELLGTCEDYLAEHESLGQGSKTYLSNGARFYTDIGDHQEYSTPEDNSYMGTCANEIAGELTMQELGELFASNYPSVCLNKRVIGEDGVSWGYHESYNVDANTVKINPDILSLHGVHLATRNIFFGAGALLTSGEYTLGQKMGSLTYGYASTTTNHQKPIVNTKDEPLADPLRFRRVHVTSGDPNMSPWATRMKLGTTSLVLRLIEHGETLGDVRLRSLVDASGTINKDTSLRGSLSLENGRTRTALEVQQLLCRTAMYLSRHVELPDEDLWTISEWERACADAAQDPALLRNRVDWVLKKQILDLKHEKHGVEWKSDRMRAFEREYGQIGPKSLATRLRSAIWQEWMPSDAVIQHRITSPPPRTRAAIRGKVVSALSKNKDKDKATLDWDYVRINGKIAPLPNPHEFTNDLVDELLREATEKAA